MIKVIDVLNLPSLREGYIAAGGGGIYNVIRQFEILEETYPSVVRFLDKGIFYVTSFWSLADDKASRIHLIEEMIEHQCAGIGIMPGVHLNDEIDREILELANDKNFPVLYIRESVRWGDLLAEYSVISNNQIEVKERNWIDLSLETFVDFHLSGDPAFLCKKLSEILRMPVVISAVTVYSHGTEGINVATLISRIQNIRQNGGKTQQSSLMIRVDYQKVALIYFGKNSMVVVCPDLMGVQSNLLSWYHQIAPFVVRELDQLSKHGKSRKIERKFQYYGDKRLYLVLMRFENYEMPERISGREYILYESNPYQKYCIFLIPEGEESTFFIYDLYAKMIKEKQPELFVFSQTKYRWSVATQEISRVKNLFDSLIYLKGIFCVEELPLLYLLANTSRENDILLYSAGQNKMMISEETGPFLQTLRLYLVIHSLKDVSRLMELHVNSVKYRIEKALQYLELEDDIPLNEIASIQLLMYLERLVLEMR